MNFLRWVALPCALAAFAGCGTEPPPEPETPPVAIAADVVYRGMRVIPGDGSPPIEEAAMAVDGRIITALGPQEEVAPPPGTPAVDLAGKTLIPALIDLHGHVGFQRGLSYDAANYTRENIVDYLRRYLYHGVGTVVSLGTDPGDLWQEIRRAQLLGALDGARLHAAGSGWRRRTPAPGRRRCGRRRPV